MSWAVDELKKISEIQPEAVERALKEMWRGNPELYKSIVIGAYIDEKISLSKAAELLEVTRIELQRELREKGIPIRVPTKEEAIAEVEALKAWKRE